MNGESNLSARDAIFNSIRGGASVKNQEKPEFSIPVPEPDYGDQHWINPTELFTEMLTRVHGSNDIISGWDGVPEAVSIYLDEIGEVKKILVAPDDKLYPLSWGEIKTENRIAEKSDRVSVTRAFAGIAETGTVAMFSSPSSPVTLNFLSEINIVILEQSRLVKTLEEFWPMVKKQPRAINFITGPSKTADIEQTIVYGAHGPKKFHVILVLCPD